MKKLLPNTDEFYVGYLPQAPTFTAEFIKRVIIVIGIVAVVISTLLVLNQRKFSATTFEYGVPTTLEGIIYYLPVPHLRLRQGEDINKKVIYQTILLVGSGKSGVDNVFKQAEVTLGNFHSRYARISGYLIYGDGKSLLQINEANDIQLTEEKNVQPDVPTIKTKGNIIMTGEIIDPKCFFGVMKPGEGKPHRSCAIRCIAGGLPPVFKSDLSEYFLLTGENGEPINQQILSIVGDQINLEGDIEEIDDWKILKVKRKYLQQISKNKALEETLLTMTEGITLCDTRY
jgi:hypothetical protein